MYCLLGMAELLMAATCCTAAVCLSGVLVGCCRCCHSAKQGHVWLNWWTCVTLQFIHP
jgi:hypothetical protein